MYKQNNAEQKFSINSLILKKLKGFILAINNCILMDIPVYYDIPW